MTLEIYVKHGVISIEHFNRCRNGKLLSFILMHTLDKQSMTLYKDYIAETEINRTYTRTEDSVTFTTCWMLV